MQIIMTDIYGRKKVNVYELLDSYIESNSIVLNKECYYQYNIQKGIWEKKSQKEIIRDISHYLEDICNNMWNTAVEREVKVNLDKRVGIVKQMNPHFNFVSLANRVMNVANGKVGRHKEKYYLTTYLPVEYRKKATCPLFDKFLSEICCGKKERMDTIREMLGYCLTKDTSAQCSFYLYGTGANGKSVLMNIMQALLGEDNYVCASPENLQETFGCGDLEDKRVVFTSDMSKKDLRYLSSGIMKQISGGDVIRSEKKYNDSVKIRSISKIVISSNHMLNFADDSTIGAIRRYVIIPFEYTIPKTKRNVHLEKELRAELPGILNEAVLGYRRLRRNNYVFSCQEESDSLIQDVIRKDVSFEKFIEEKIVYCQNDFVSYKELENAYLEWAENKQQVVACPSSRTMGDMITQSIAGSALQKRNQRGVLNIRLN